MKGKLVVLEGMDGTGKETQTRLLAQRLAQTGAAFQMIDFPRYGNPFAEPARQYLAGALGEKPERINAYAASLFYAVDRYASYQEEWGVAYEQGALILTNRYTTSNAIYQASKLTGQERREFLLWLFDLEYRKLGLPIPDLVLYLDMPLEVSEYLRRGRKKDSDIHERDNAYLRACQKNAEELLEDLGWQRIFCTRNGNVCSKEEIHENIWDYVVALQNQN